MEDNVALKTAFPFNLSLLCAKFIQKYNFSAEGEPKNINFNTLKTGSKNISLHKIFRPKNVGHASLPVLNGSAPEGKAAINIVTITTPRDW